ncbi:MULTISPECIES: Rgg/GadR/MutR family transcriptional regulator [unclassified Streptococcus]|uniref:Rgg/GadR/MutR family transcriptional regulator n=1 Tax=unclassified Streptococcus TaxID=2608887 RepID=UPI001FFCDEF6|nr:MULTISPECIES: Rgg/GadR/MutR family transcriptional regulator [unclassified Streptococcus]
MKLLPFYFMVYNCLNNELKVWKGVSGMERDRTVELGEFYKEMRLARRVKQKDVVRNHFSVSQLSKFEAGQSMLTADKLLYAIEGINMSFSEFALALRDYQPLETDRLIAQISQLTMERDLDGLKNLLKLHEESDRLYDRLNSFIIKSGISIFEPGYEFSEEDRSLLTRYLFDIEQWTAYELHLFGNAMSLLTDMDLLFLGKELVKKSKLYLSLTNFQIGLKRLYINLISELIEREQGTHIEFFVDQLKSLLALTDVFEKIVLDFLICAKSYLLDKKVTRYEVELYIRKVRDFGCIPLSEYLTDRLVHMELILRKDEDTEDK